MRQIVEPDKKQKALVTILDEEETKPVEKSIVGSIEIIDEDLESASRLISQNFNQSLENSAEKLETIEALKPAIAEMKAGKGETVEESLVVN